MSTFHSSDEPSDWSADAHIRNAAARGRGTRGCGHPRSDPVWVHGPKAGQKTVEALHEPKVGRAVLCAPAAATTISCRAQDGAHGVTRPTSVNRFTVPMRGQRTKEAFHEPQVRPRFRRPLIFIAPRRSQGSTGSRHALLLIYCADARPMLEVEGSHEYND